MRIGIPWVPFGHYSNGHINSVTRPILAEIHIQQVGEEHINTEKNEDLLSAGIPFSIALNNIVPQFDTSIWPSFPPIEDQEHMH
jgi:hypothetical protein